MNTFHSTLVAAPCLALAAFAFEPFFPQAPGTGQALAPALSDVAQWRERLGDADLDARERAFDELVGIVARNPGEQGAVEGWSRDASDPEFAWTCRLALREARNRSADAFTGSADPFETLRRRMFAAPGTHFFADPFSMDPFGSGSLFGRFSIDPGWTAGAGSSFHGTFTMETTPDGVKVRVQKNVDGEVKAEEFTAKSVEELLEAHPELREHLGVRTGALSGGFRFGWPGNPLQQPSTRALRTDLLGVKVPAVPEEQDPDGLRIDSVVPGTLAEHLRFQAGDVLLSINGRALKSRDDISAALRERKPDQGIDVEVRGADGKVETRSWKPEDTRGVGRKVVPPVTGGVRKL